MIFVDGVAGISRIFVNMALVKKIIKNSGKRSGFLLFGLIFAFAVFAFLSIHTMKSISKSDETLKEKGERIARLIIASNAESLMDYNIAALKGSIQSFIKETDVKAIVIIDGTGKILVNESRKTRSTSEETVTIPIRRGDMKIGTLKLTVTNSSRWVKTNRTVDLVASSSVDHLWDYNVSALKSNASSFFKDADIKKLYIREESGIELVRLEKESAGSEELEIKKELYKDKRFIGTLVMTFCDCTYVQSDSRRKQAMMIYILLTGVLGLGIAIVVFWGSSRPAETYDENGSAGIDSQGGAAWAISDSTEKKMERAIEYIKENFVDSISREGLASHLELNPDNLGRYFKLYTGEKINDYINRLRIEAAAKLLTATEDSIVEIAYAVGFENISTFNRAFQKIHNQTPTDYRKIK